MSTFYKNKMMEDLEKNANYTLFLDLDGVLVDYSSGWLNIIKKLGYENYSEEDEKHIRKEYSKDIVGFWAGLKWIEGGQNIYSESIRLFKNVHILSSAGTENETTLALVTEGKKKWCQKHLSQIPNRNVHIVPRRFYKKNFSNKFSILIDDMKDTIQGWNQRGGYGILHSSNHYQKTIDTLEGIAQPIDLSEIIRIK